MEGLRRFFELLKSLPSSWKVLLVSRPDSWFKLKLLETLGDHLDRKEITPEDNGDDVRKYIDKRVRDIASQNCWTPELKAEASHVLSSKAEGMFMWAELLCNELEFKDGANEEDTRS